MMIFVTGVAGFIGYHVAAKLLAQGQHVVGVDNCNDYYDVALKKARLKQLEGKEGFSFIHADIADKAKIAELFKHYQPEIVIHLAAQAGVRYSLENPDAYIHSNIQGLMTILEGCRHHPVKHLIAASSSSVYGLNTKMPFSEHDGVDHPVSLYAATKRSGELIAHSYSHLYDIPITCLRFFTVYGPWGRPDMALFLFTKAILDGRPIKVFNQGKMSRDFTYIDDVVEGVLRLMEHVPTPMAGSSNPSVSPEAPFRVFNIGHHTPVKLLDMIGCLENALGKTAQKEMLPMQPGDVHATYADVDDLYTAVGYQPTTPIEQGIAHFVQWYLEFNAQK